MNADTPICPFWMAVDKCRDDAELVLLLPEFAAERIAFELIGDRWLRDAATRRPLTINILNQNRDVMVSPRFVQSLKSLNVQVTITAAPYHWASPEEQLRYGAPVHWVPTWYYKDDAAWQPYESKQNLMIVSPDRNPNRERVIDAIKRACPSLELRVIENMSFESYTNFETQAKWSLTFGEGCDGYFYGPAMRGGVSFAVHNDTFSGWDLGEWRTLYSSYDDMISRIGHDISGLDAKSPYESYSRRLRSRFSKFRSLEALRGQLESFYRGNYCFHPAHTQRGSEVSTHNPHAGFQ